MKRSVRQQRLKKNTIHYSEHFERAENRRKGIGATEIERVHLANSIALPDDTFSKLVSKFSIF